MTPLYLPLQSSARRSSVDKFSLSRKPAERRIRRRWLAAELLDAFVPKLQAQSEFFSQTMEKPEDNWPWLLLILPPAEELQVVGIARDSLKSAESRAAFSDSMTKLAKEHNAIALAFLRGYQIGEADQEPESASEVVLIEEARGDFLSLHLAAVQRFPDKPPTLGPWSKSANPDLLLMNDCMPILRDNYERFVF